MRIAGFETFRDYLAQRGSRYGLKPAWNKGLLFWFLKSTNKSTNKKKSDPPSVAVFSADRPHPHLKPAHAKISL